jgi:hypothetical protein
MPASEDRILTPGVVDASFGVAVAAATTVTPCLHMQPSVRIILKVIKLDFT